MMKTLAFSLALGAACVPAFASQSAADACQGKVVVAASFDAMAEFTRAVGGNYVCVQTIIPAGQEPHDFEPTIKTVKLLKEADLFVVNGLGMESWATKTAQAAENSKLQIVVASEGAEAVVDSDVRDAEHRGAYDPHLWLSLDGAKHEAGRISRALSKFDPEHAAAYRENFEKFSAELKKLSEEYARQFAQAKRKFFFTGHAAFAYLCREFGLKQRSVEGVYAEGEPSAKQLAALALMLKNEGVKTVFAEELASPAVSQALAREAGAKVVKIYTVEGPEDGLSYLARMKENLERILKSLRQ